MIRASARFALGWAVVALVAAAGCHLVHPRETAARDDPAARLLQSLGSAARARDLQALAAQLTPECRQGCRGFVPLVLSAPDAAYQISGWAARLRGSSLLVDLLSALGSFARVERFSLRPIRLRRFGQRVLFRARLDADGIDLAGHRRSDRGILDGAAVQRGGRWRLDALDVGRVHTVRRAEAGYEAAAAPGAPGASIAALGVAAGGGVEIAAARGRQVSGWRIGRAQPGAPPEPLFDARCDVDALHAADVDGDGRTDLFVVCGAGGGRLWRNAVDGWRPRATVAGPVRGALFADLDGDAVLDLLVARPAARGGAASPALFIGRGDGRFRAAPAPQGLANARDLCAGDLDGDGALEVIAADDAGRATVWSRRRAGRLERVFAAAVRGHGCAVGDVDGDGRLDVAVGRELWLNRARKGRALRFVRSPQRALRGAALPRGFFDHDNDGRVELLVARAGRGAAEALLLAIGAAPRVELVDASFVAGLRGAGPSLVLDLDGDRALDLARGAQRLRWRGGRGEVGEEGATHGVLLALRAGAAGNRQAIGSTVQIEVDGRRQVRAVGLASGMPGGPPGWVHFGVGGSVRVAAVTVRWPDGQVERHVDLPVDRAVSLRQGRPVSWDEAPAAEDAELAEAAASAPASRPAPAPAVGGAQRVGDVLGPRLGAALAQVVRGRAGVLLLAPPACARCRADCQALRRALARRSGVAFVVLGDRGLRCGAPTLSVPEERLRALSPLLPATLIVDAAGAVRGITAGEPNAAQLAADLDALTD